MKRKRKELEKKQKANDHAVHVVYDLWKKIEQEERNCERKRRGRKLRKTKRKLKGK